MKLARILLCMAAISGCDDPGASFTLEDQRATRLPDGRVVVEGTLHASELMGGNLGGYCVYVTFPGQAKVLQDCRADLHDGDTKYLYYVSDAFVPAGLDIFLSARIGLYEAGAKIVSPP